MTQDSPDEGPDQPLAAALTFANVADEFSGVSAVSSGSIRWPPRVTTYIDGNDIPPGIYDYASTFNATMAGARIADGKLCVEWTVEVPHRDCGTHMTRTHGGSSTVVTLTPSAIEVSAIDSDTQVSEQARPGEIVLQKW